MRRANITAKFTPKNIATLRDCMVPYVGTMLELQWAGPAGGEDEPYPGQERWMTTSDFEIRVNMPDDACALWIPEEDLSDIQTIPTAGQLLT